jgi:hypothetical protein
MSEELKENIDKEYKWSTAKFLIGITKLITSQEFIVFVVYSLIMTNKGMIQILITDITNDNNAISVINEHTWIIGYIVICCIFILKKCLEKVLEIIAHNTKINAELKLGIQKDIFKDTAKVLKVLNEIKINDKVKGVI